MLYFYSSGVVFAMYALCDVPVFGGLIVMVESFLFYHLFVCGFSCNASWLVEVSCCV